MDAGRERMGVIPCQRGILESAPSPVECHNVVMWAVG